jgi:hypothetical protein
MEDQTEFASATLLRGTRPFAQELTAVRVVSHCAYRRSPRCCAKSRVWGWVLKCQIGRCAGGRWRAAGGSVRGSVEHPCVNARSLGRKVSCKS